MKSDSHLVASAARPLRLCARNDLVISRQRYQGRTYWVIKDPCALRYFRLTEEEYTVFRLLDGKLSIEDIRRRLEDEFPRKSVSSEVIQRYVAELHSNCLVISEAGGQGRELHRRAGKRRAQRFISRATNILCIRFRGIDPGRVLAALYPCVRWCFTVPAAIFALILAVSAIGLVIVQFETFRTRLPEAEEYFTPATALSILAGMAFLKILHELGHGLSCHHFGGKCHEIGVMLLIFTPCLYCNVTDSWLMPNRWHRVIIGAAGMLVELVIAAACTFLWWFSEPGLLNQICLNLMLVGSVSTLLFNANPLMKFDGYFILCDILETPSLANKGREEFRRFIAQKVIGLRQYGNSSEGGRGSWWMGVYGACSMAYRCFLVVSIGWMLHHAAKQYRLESLVVMMFAVSFTSLSGTAAWKAFKFWLTPGRLRTLDIRRHVLSVGIICTALLAFFLIPFSRSFVCEFEVQPAAGQFVYVSLPGTLTEALVAPGDRVSKGQVLARLYNADAQCQFDEIQRQVLRQELRLKDLRRRRSLGDRDAELSLTATYEELRNLELLLAQKAEELTRLTLTAEVDGVVIPPPSVRRPVSSLNRLPNRFGNPLETRNLGCHLRQGELFCIVADPNKLKAVLTVEQSDVGTVQPGQLVKARFDGTQGRIWKSRVSDVSFRELDRLSGELTAGTREPERQADSTTMWSKVYRASVHLTEDINGVRIGQRGLARVYTGRMTIAGRLWRFLSRTFHFNL